MQELALEGGNLVNRTAIEQVSLVCPMSKIHMLFFENLHWAPEADMKLVNLEHASACDSKNDFGRVVCVAAPPTSN